MKKLLMLSAAAFVLSPAAFAEDAPATPPTGGHHKDMLAEIDTDGDGAVSKAEFLAFHEKRFAEIDTNSDGKIEKAEAEAKKAEWKEKRKAHMKDKGEAAPAETPPVETPPAE